LSLQGKKVIHRGGILKKFTKIKKFSIIKARKETTEE